MPSSIEAAAARALSPFGLRWEAGEDRPLGAAAPARVREAALRSGLVLLRGFAAPSRDEFLAWCRSFPGPGLLEWESGPVMEMAERPGSPNYLFSRERVPFHWDGAFHKTPAFLAFHCVAAPAPGAGGETLFAATGLIWNDASPEERELWGRVRLAFATEKLAHYGGRFTTPMLEPHPVTRRPILRFAEPVETALNPVSLEVSGIGAEEGRVLVEAMRRRLYDPAYRYEHSWREGDVVVADNHAVLHARRAFAKDCPRHLRRIQIL